MAWRLIDAEGKALGRRPAQPATNPMGKHDRYTPHVLTGDFVVVINAEKVKLTGRMEQKEYDRYKYHPGGRRSSRSASCWPATPTA